MNPSNSNFSKSPAPSTANMMLRRSTETAFLYPSRLKKLEIKPMTNCTFKPPKMSSARRHSEGSALTSRRTGFPYSLKPKDNDPLTSNECSSLESSTKISSIQLGNAANSKENEMPDQHSKGNSPVLKSRRSRRKSLKLACVSTPMKKCSDNHRRMLTSSAGEKVQNPIPSEIDCNNAADNLNNTPPMDYADIFSEFLCEEGVQPLPTTKASSSEVSIISGTTFTKQNVLEVDEKQASKENKDANDTFDSMFSCTDEELLACVCEEFDKPEAIDNSSTTNAKCGTSSEDPHHVNGLPKVDTKFQGLTEKSIFGFQTASKKNIQISKNALLRAESLLCFDCLGDPL